jgi:hypothetical protein
MARVDISEIEIVAPNKMTRKKDPNRSGTQKKEDITYDDLLCKFEDLIGMKGRPFGQSGRPAFGMSDGNNGVQRSIIIIKGKKIVYLGVNLEGLTYNNWPIARLLLSEQENSTFETLRPNQDKVLLCMRRDAWQRQSRPAIDEQFIQKCENIPVVQITSGDWAKIVHESLDCLNADRNHLGRGRQMVTRRNAKGEPNKDMMEVSPHLTFLTPIALSGSDMQEGLTRLEPFYQWTDQRSR